MRFAVALTALLAVAVVTHCLPQQPEPVKPMVLQDEVKSIPPAKTITEVADAAEVEAVAEETEVKKLVYLGKWYITGYCTCQKCCGKTNGITASGTTATVGRTCVARDLPFGTILHIDGIGERVVEDRGGGIGENHVDVLCENHDKCYAITGQYDIYLVAGGEEING